MSDDRNRPSSAGEALRLLLPKEHGSWSLVLEPLALGLMVAPSAVGAALAVAVLAAFFLRRPLQLLLANHADPRRRTAWAVVLILSLVAAGGLGLAGAWGGWLRLAPLLAAAVPGLAFVWLESRGESRAAGAEISGAVALAAVPPALATLAGWRASPAMALGLVMACRSVPTILAIRAFLRRRKGQAVSAIPPLAAGLLAVLVVIALVRAGLAPVVGIPVFVILLLRTGMLLGLASRPLRATTLGIGESMLGALVVVALGIAWGR